MDVGVSMDPFARDQIELRESLIEVVGESLLEEWNFEGHPDKGLEDPATSERVLYRAPTPGRLVLVLSDLGCGGPRVNATRSSSAEWRRFASRLAARGSSVIALSPSSSQRWPPKVDPLRILSWDRSTSVSIVSALRGGKRGD